MSLIASELMIYGDVSLSEVCVVDNLGGLPCRWVRRADLIIAKMDGDTLMLDAHAGAYYGLDAVGGKIWEYLAVPVTIADLVERLTAEYEVETERCTRDVAALIEQLSARNIVEMVDV